MKDTFETEQQILHDSYRSGKFKDSKDKYCCRYTSFVFDLIIITLSNPVYEGIYRHI